MWRSEAETPLGFVVELADERRGVYAVHRSPDPHRERLAAAAGARSLLPPAHECRALREAAGLTQRQLGELVGVSAHRLGYWERGWGQPGHRFAQRYLDVMRSLRRQIG